MKDTPRFEFLMVTYHKDFEWAEFTLRSMKKFGSGDFGITLVVPHSDKNLFGPLCERFGCNLRICLPMPGKEFLHHMAHKMYADVWVPNGTDYVIHIDADCVFGEPFTPWTFMHDNKPILVREHFGDFVHHPHRSLWRANIQNNLGFDCEWETMVRHPFIAHVDLYRKIRDHIEALHKYPFEQYVCLQKESYPYTFTEFPDMGAFVLKFEPERYQVVTTVVTPGEYWRDPKWLAYGIKPIDRDANRMPLSKDHPWRFFWHKGDDMFEAPLCNPIRYFWSRKGVTPEYRKQLDAILAS